MKKQKIEMSEKGFMLDGKPFMLLSGDIHYFRIHPSGWRRRLELMRDFGLTAVETYVPWNLHEPREGEFNFEGMCDLAAFLRLCAEMDFKVLLRPTPYICSECDFGGIPAWILRDKAAVVRANDEGWLKAVSRYYKAVCDVFRPYLSTNGGPVIMVAVENEYGYYASDRKYMLALKEMLEENGIDVPLFTTDPFDGKDRTGIANGSIPGCLEGINYRSEPGIAPKAFEVLKEYQPGLPKYIGELWCGRQIHWLSPYKKRDPKPTVECFKECLETGASVNFYMFCGGTNFGFFNGAIKHPEEGAPKEAEPIYFPQATSYDVDALVSENGEPTEKYFLCRDVLDEFLGKPKRPHVAPEYKTQEIEVKLTECASLWENLDNLAMTHTKETAPHCMECYGQDYGYILYRVYYEAIDGVTSARLHTKEVTDYAAIYQNGKYIDYWLRDRKKPLTVVELDGNNAVFDILAENLGRNNNSAYIEDNRKGIEGYIAIGQPEQHNIETFTLPMSDISGLKYRSVTASELGGSPMFLKGTFDAEEGVDTFFSLEGFEHGFVVINGFNIGRYLPWGPQKTLYIPGELLRGKDNVIEIFDLSPKSLVAKLSGTHSLEM